MSENSNQTLKNADDSAPAAAVVEIFRVYKSRWFVLFVVAALNCVNALSWISYAPVANLVDDFYQADGTTNVLTMVFLAVSVPVGLLAMWSTGKFGIRSAILAASWFNGVGAVLRLFSSLDFVDQSVRRPMVIGGQCVAACAYPFIMFLPTKTSAAWFPDGQRAKANTLATLANPLGVLVAMSLAPALVFVPSDVLFLNLLTSVLSVLICVAATLGVRTSEPPTPPTRGAAQRSTPFWPGVKKLATSKSFLILFFSLGSGIGMFNALYGIMQQLLCARGYTNNFAALCCALMIIGGFFGAFSSAFLVDKTKKFAEIMKSAFSLAVLSGVVFSFCALKPDLAPAIGASCFVFGFFGLAAYPIGLEMAVECSFPVAETTSAGFVVLGGQILGTVYMIGMSSLRSELTGNDTLIETCTLRENFRKTTTTLPEMTSATVTGRPEIVENAAKAYDMTLPMAVFCSTAGLVVLFFILAFRPKLRRLKLENEQWQQGASKNLLNNRIEEKSLDQEMLDLSQLKKQKRQEFLNATA